MKRVFLLMLYVLICPKVAAENEDCVVVEFHDGEKVVYQFEEKPQVSFEGDNVRIFSQSKAESTYSFLSIKQIYFVSENVSVSDAEALSDVVKFKVYVKNAVRVSGLKAQDVVGVYNANGVLLNQYSGNEELNIDLSSYDNGIYVVNVNKKQSIKILKK